MKNICLTIHSLTSSGGEERMCVLLANELSRLGYYVIVVTLNQLKNEKSIYKLTSLIPRCTLISNRLERKLFSYRVLKNLKLIRYKHILQKHKIDIVIDVDIHQSLTTTKVTKGTPIKVISWDHFNYHQFKERWSHSIMMDCFTSGEVDKLIVLTNSDKKNFIEQESLKENFVDSINNPCPFERNKFLPHNQKKVLSVGRLTNQKGFDLLIDTWAKVERKNNQWKLEIVGDGIDKDMLQEKVETLHLQNVILTSYTENIESKYADASIYVLPSRTEGFGLVLVEAETMSIPLVAFNCGGPGEIIKESYNGFLVEPENIDMLADKLLELMDNDTLREQMSHNAFEDSKKYRMENIIGKWIELIEII